MVDMMQGVTRGGGTAPGANAGGHPLAGKTGTVNDHTDVWFIGYTPTYVTGIWMGNPLRKENLGNSMTGGHGAVPYFNAFMIPFMKDKPRDRFYDTPAMPSDIKALAEQKKREDAERAAEENNAIGSTNYGGGGGGGGSSSRSSKTGTTTSTNPDTPGNGVSNPNISTDTGDAPPPVKQPKTKTGDDKPIVKPPVETPKKTEPPKEERKPEGNKKKGKKGDDDGQ